MHAVRSGRWKEWHRKPRAVDASNRRRTLTSVPRPLVQQRLETGKCQRAANSRTKDRHCTSAGEVLVVDDVRDNGIVSSDRGTAVHIVLQRSWSTGFDGRSNGESVLLLDCAVALQPTDIGLGTARWR